MQSCATRSWAFLLAMALGALLWSLLAGRADSAKSVASSSPSGVEHAILG